MHQFKPFKCINYQKDRGKEDLRGLGGVATVSRIYC